MSHQPLPLQNSSSSLSAVPVSSSISDGPTIPAPTSNLEPQAEQDPYDGFDDDPPAHYPKPGNGLARTMRPENEDLQWLVDDNFEVFSHIYKGDGDGMVGTAGVGESINGF